jgi:putative ABC transport system permease protein
MAEPRFITLLLSGFAGLAVLQACSGVYGVMSYMVAQRTHEIGVRMALGASKPDLLRMVLGRGLRIAGIGVGIGLVGALGLTRILAILLYDISPADPATFISVSVVLSAVAMLASYIPARRATKVDPLVALKYE